MDITCGVYVPILAVNAVTTVSIADVADAASIDGVDLDAVATCECVFVRGIGAAREVLSTCDNPAQWWGVHTCCGIRGKYCHTCRARCSRGGRTGLNVCGECGGHGMDWTAI